VNMISSSPPGSVVMLVTFSGSVSRSIVSARTSLTLELVLTFNVITLFSMLTLAM
jgi:hypothetical protein